MPKHLIKRKEVDFNLKDGWYCETKLKSWPTGEKVKKGDLVYIAQAGYAIYGQGIVNDVIKNEFDTFDNFLFYALHKSNVKDDGYWLLKFKEYSKNFPCPKIKIIEYELINTECFNYTIPLEQRFLYQPVWYYLEDNFTFQKPQIHLGITEHIPTNVRTLIYHMYKINSKEHIIDIDHFVPRSIGGPGNIIENLIPISASINRRKSNHVPSKLLDLAKQFGEKKPKNLIVSHDKFYADRESLNLAKRIVEKINLQNDSDLRITYKTIRDFHFPYLINIKNQ